MAQSQIDTQLLSKTYADRIRTAARPTLNESRLVKTAAVQAQRQRVIGEVAQISSEMRQLSTTDKSDVSRQLAEIFGIERQQFEMILKEASVSGIMDLGSYWGKFFISIGL